MIKKTKNSWLFSHQKKAHYINVLEEVGCKFLLLNDDLSNYEIGCLIRRSAFRTPYNLLDTNFFILLFPKSELAKSKGYKSDTFCIYGSEMFEDADLVQEMKPLQQPKFVLGYRRQLGI